MIVLLLWVMCVFPCWHSVSPGMYVNSHLFQHCWTSSCDSSNRGSLWVTSTSRSMPSGGRSMPCEQWRLTASFTSPRSVLLHLLPHPGQSYLVFYLTQVSQTASSTSPRSVLSPLLPHPGLSYLIFYLTLVSLTSSSTSLFTVGLLDWVCWLSKLITPAESSERFCFGFGLPLSHAFSAIVINAHSVHIHLQLLTWLDKVKQQPMDIKKGQGRCTSGDLAVSGLSLFCFLWALFFYMPAMTTTKLLLVGWYLKKNWIELKKTFQTLIHNGTVCGLTVCATAASTMFCTTLFTLDSLSQWKIMGRPHLLDRFLRLFSSLTAVWFLFLFLFFMHSEV